MAKVIRSFGKKASAAAWVEKYKSLYKGKVIGGSTFSSGSGKYKGMVYGEITQEMADSMRPRCLGNGVFIYKQ